MDYQIKRIYTTLLHEHVLLVLDTIESRLKHFVGTEMDGRYHYSNPPPISGTTQFLLNYGAKR